MSTRCGVQTLTTLSLKITIASPRFVLLLISYDDNDKHGGCNAVSSDMAKPSMETHRGMMPKKRPMSNAILHGSSTIYDLMKEGPDYMWRQQASGYALYRSSAEARSRRWLVRISLPRQFCAITSAGGSSTQTQIWNTPRYKLASCEETKAGQGTIGGE
jgi:hypothetical protein